MDLVTEISNICKGFSADVTQQLGIEFDGMTVRVELPEEIVSTLPRIAAALEKIAGIEESE